MRSLNSVFQCTEASLFPIVRKQPSKEHVPIALQPAPDNRECFCIAIAESAILYGKYPGERIRGSVYGNRAADSESAAQAGRLGRAVIFSLIQTAIENGLDPWRYLTWLIDSAAKDDADAESLFPWTSPDACRVSA